VNTPVLSRDVERRALALFDAALDVAPPERTAWLAAQCEGDDVLQQRVAALLLADVEGSRLWSADPGPARGDALRPPAQIGPYRLEELIGSGGMGAVYRARRNDGLFEQTVAIKFVRPFAAHATVDALIDAERRTLARLQHPGIARILDGGTTTDGLPYLVMELVQGVPIDQHVRDHTLPADARVVLLLEVCAALADAHRHLVLHCDIKPANILVGEDGRTKLIDFGIARLRDAIEPLLPHGFTRAYASPQRLAGAPPTVADDLYALGLLLVELVGGRLPSGPGDIAHQTGGALDDELAAIARRALDADPHQRYATVDAFADDLRRWREKRPVAALPPHWRYRARKLLQRHPWRVAAAALAASGLVVALVVISALYARADAARREAEQRFSEVRSLANYLLFDLDARLESTPGTTALRRDLVERSQRYLDALAQRSGNDPELEREIAVGLGRLAEVQGGWAMPNVGERVAARATFERAQKMLQTLLTRRPDDWRLHRDLGRLQQRLADFYGGIDNDSRRQLATAREAEGHLREAVARASAIIPRDQGELQALLNSARLTQAFAMDWIDEGEAAAALARDEEARLLALPPAVRAEMEFEFRVGRSVVQLGDSLYFLNRFDEALDAYRRSQRHYALALDATPNHRKLLDASAVSRWGAALSLTELGRHQEALAEIDTALTLGRRLLALDPTNDNAQRLTLILRTDRSLVLGRLKQYDEAIALAHEVLRERRARAERSPDISEPARDAVVPLHALADLYWRQGDVVAACEASRRAIAGWAAFARRFGLTELDRKQNAEKEQETARRCTR
jgi:tetratricopeptide (TPR) repeat protein